MRNLKMKSAIVTAALGALMLLTPVVGAQDISKGGLFGVVRDATSAVVADADVTLSSPFGERKTKTNSVGEYVFANLTPGTGYSLSVEKQGFSTAKVPDLT